MAELAEDWSPSEPVHEFEHLVSIEDYAAAAEVSDPRSPWRIVVHVEEVVAGGPSGAIAEISVREEVDQQPPRCARAPQVERAHIGRALAGNLIDSVPAISPQRRESLSPGLDDVVLVVGHPGVTPHAPTHVVDLPDPESAAHRLYTVLRACDARDARRILVLMPPDVPAWQAVRDRLWRATVPG